jgi:predicted TIM-barrel fold metal-dependent hydrolase
VRTIALEEHFWTAELAAPPGTGPLAVWGPRLGDQLRDLGSLRLADMDSAGIDLQVISHVAPAAQGQAGAEGLARAREANDQLAAAVHAHPDRFAGFATLPTADPRAAADELERATTELGFVGALVNSTVQVLGVDRVLFSVDYPFGSNAAGRALLDMLPLSPDDVAKIAGGNAERVLGLKPAGS